MQKLSLQTGFGEQLQGYNITFRNILQASLKYCMLYRNSFTCIQPYISPKLNIILLSPIYLFVRITCRRVSLQNKENMIEPYESIANGNIDVDAKKYSQQFIRQLVRETPGDSPSWGKTWNFVRM